MIDNKTIGVIGHVNHGKTALSAIASSLVLHSTKEVQQLNEIIKDEKSIEIVSRADLVEAFPKDGKAKRRDRRKNNR